MDAGQPAEPFPDRERFRIARGRLFYPKADLDGGYPEAVRPLEGVFEQLGQGCLLHLGVELQTLTPLGKQGTFHRLYQLTLADGRTLVARLNALSGVSRDYPLLLDRWATSKLRQFGLPSLQVYAVDLSRQHGPWDYELLDPACGVPLDVFDQEELPLRPMLQNLGAFLASVHRIPTRGYGLLVPEADGVDTAGACPTWMAYLENHLERHVAVCRDIGAVSSGEADAVLRSFDDARAHLTLTRPVLLHGDPGSHNVFVEGGQVTTLIDWEDALSGDPVYEVAFWATFHPEPRHAPFLAGYHGTQRYEDSFWFRFWLYFLRVALAKTVLRHNLGLKDRPGRRPASLRIQRALEGLRNVARAA